MISIACVGANYYGKEINSIEDDIKDINEFVERGCDVILVKDLDCLETLKDGLTADDVIMSKL